MVTAHITISGIRVSSNDVTFVSDLLNTDGFFITTATQALLPSDISDLIELHHPGVIISVVALHIAIDGIRISSNDVTSISGLLDAICFIITAATQALLPFYITGAVELHHPGVIISVIAAYITISGIRIPHDNIPSISGLLDAVCFFIVTATQALLPLDISDAVELHHPGVIIPVVTAHITISGIRKPCDDVTSISGLLDVDGIIITTAAQAFLPLDGADAVELHNPSVIISVVATHIIIIGIRISGDDVTISGLLDAICFIITTATQAFLPLDGADAVELHQPGVTSSAVATHITISGIRISCDDATSISGLLDAVCFIKTTATQAFLPHYLRDAGRQVIVYRSADRTLRLRTA